MIILAIDSAMNGCSACLYDDMKGEVASKTLEISRGQAEHLMPMIDDIVKNYDDIDLIAVTKGPGAFTGMRIGIATAKSLGLALDIPVLGVSTFRAILETYMGDKNNKTYPYYGTLLETKRSDYYFQMFEGQGLKPCIDAMIGSAQDIQKAIGNKECLMLGDASNRFKTEINSGSFAVSFIGSFENILIPSPSSIASIALLDYNNSDIDGDIDIDCTPIYLRLPEIGVPKNKPRNLK